MNYIKHILSIFIMLLIPYFTINGLSLLFDRDEWTKEQYEKAREIMSDEEYDILLDNKYYERLEYSVTSDRMKFLIGISIIVLSYQLKFNVWGVPAGGTILILFYLRPILFGIARGMQFIIAGISIVILTFIANTYFNKNNMNI